jgi:hypothetical protein
MVHSQYNVQQNPNTNIGYTNPSPNPAPSQVILNPMSNSHSPMPYQHPTFASPNYVPVCVGNNSVRPTHTGFSGPDPDMSPINTSLVLIPRATQKFLHNYILQCTNPLMWFRLTLYSQNPCRILSQRIYTSPLVCPLTQIIIPKISMKPMSNPVTVSLYMKHFQKHWVSSKWTKHLNLYRLITHSGRVVGVHVIYVLSLK